MLADRFTDYSPKSALGAGFDGRDQPWPLHPASSAASHQGTPRLRELSSGDELLKGSAADIPVSANFRFLDEPLSVCGRCVKWFHFHE